MGLKLGAEYIQLGGPAVVNDMLLAGAAHFAPAGPPAFITIWDRTRANMKVMGVAAMTSIPMYLNTKAPHLKSLKDLTPNDKIAVTAVKVSIPAIIMQMAAIKEFGKADYAHYDPYTVSLQHPEGVIALLSGKSEITAHFTSPPFHQRERRDPAVRTITTSNEIMGEPEHLHDALRADEIPRREPEGLCGGAQGAAGCDRLHQRRQEGGGRGLPRIRGRQGLEARRHHGNSQRPRRALHHVAGKPDDLCKLHGRRRLDQDPAEGLAGHVLPGHSRHSGTESATERNEL